MKLPVIKQLVETAELDTLRAAENALLEEAPLPLTVEGSDEGEQLTHVLAAIWIKEQMAERNLDYKTALREYTTRVRECIN